MMPSKEQDNVFQDPDSDTNSRGNCKKEELGEEEIAILHKIEAQNRLLEVDTKSLKSISSEGFRSTSRRSSGRSISPTSAHGVVSPSNSDDASHVEDDQWALWGSIVNNWDEYKRKREKELRDHVRRGVPRHFRGIVWQLLCEAHGCPVKDKYSELLKRNSPSAKLIKRDIARTYPDNAFFKDKVGQDVLFNVTKAYSLVDREVGYCQGSAFIAGLLLLEMPEEEAFAVFVTLMNNYKLRDLFKPSMAELGVCMFQLDSMLQEHAPDLCTHFQAQGLHTSMYASSWFLTLFATTFNLQVASRIMDVFMSEGMEIIFRIGLAMLQSRHQQLLQLDMEGILTVISKRLPEYYNQNPDALFNEAYTAVKYNAKKMKKLEKEYMSKKAKEIEEQMEMRRLHTENRQLRQRVDALERENGNLANKLILDRVNWALEAEEKMKIGRELSIAKRQARLGKNSIYDGHQHGDSTTVVHGLNCEQTSTPPNGQSSISPVSTPIVQSKNALQASLTVTYSDEFVSALQQELAQAKLREVKSTSTLAELKEKISALEDWNRELTDKSSITALQQELIAVKLREAESNGCLKQLQQRVDNLKQDWQNHLARAVGARKSSTGGSKLSKAAMQELQEELMSAKFRETQLVSQNLESRRKLTELELSNEVCASQLRQANEERTALKEDLAKSYQREKALDLQLDEYRSRVTLSEGKCSELRSFLRDAGESFSSDCLEGKPTNPAAGQQPRERILEQNEVTAKVQAKDGTGAASSSDLLQYSHVDGSDSNATPWLSDPDVLSNTDIENDPQTRDLP